MSVTTARHRRPAARAADPAGNERLTALTGSALLVGFLVEGVTVLSVGRLLTMHVFLGMLLTGPVALKIATTSYRFARYYTGAAAYVRKGPPAPLLRAIGPFVILTSVAVLGTGVMLGIAGPGPGPWLLLHKAAFVLWFCVMTIHVLAYSWRLPRILRGSRAGPGRPGRNERARWLLVGISLAGGLVVALLTVHLAAPWYLGHQLRPVTRPGFPRS